MCRILLLVFLSSIIAASAQCPQNESNLRMDDDSTLYLKPGDTFKFRCTVDGGPAFLMEHKLNIVHRSGKTGQEQSITEQGSEIKGRQEYEFKFDFTPAVYAELTIKSVMDDMDGEFLCQVKAPSKPDCTIAKKIVVVGGIDKVLLNVDGFKYRKNNNNHLSKREGIYRVTCDASGSNPEPVLHLQIGDQMMTAPNVVITDEGSQLDRRSYKVSAAVNLEFTHDMFGKMLKCHAATKFPEGVIINVPDKSAAVIMDGILDQPEVVCTNTSAGVNDRKITVRCLVKSVAPLEMSYNVGNRYVLYPGNQTDDLTEVIKEVDGENQVMILKFYVMENWHFTAHIYLDIKYGSGKEFQTPVYLLKAGPDDINGASSLTGAIILTVLCTFAVLRL